MAKEVASDVAKQEKCSCDDDCCSQNPILSGFKRGLGFWLAGLLVFLLVAAVTTALFYLV
jgi:hypothetical protein